jgi:hypothetical protein
MSPTAHEQIYLAIQRVSHYDITNVPFDRTTASRPVETQAASLMRTAMISFDVQNNK